MDHLTFERMNMLGYFPSFSQSRPEPRPQPVAQNASNVVEVEACDLQGEVDKTPRKIKAQTATRYDGKTILLADDLALAKVIGPTADHLLYSGTVYAFYAHDELTRRSTYWPARKATATPNEFEKGVNDADASQRAREERLGG
jgi:hypothetical protein